MVIDSAATLIQQLRDHRLLDHDQLAYLTGRPNPLGLDFRLLAKSLVRQGWLTMYQCNQVLHGHASQLAIGPYRLLEPLGDGGVTQVFKARDTRADSIVVVKILREEYLSNTEIFGRFVREMETTARLSHPNIIRCHDVERGRPQHYFAMEYLEGGDLGKLVGLSGPLPIRQACDCAAQAARGLHYLHEHGLVHRDVKPGNLFLATRDQVVKILDLGLTRLPSAGPHAADSFNLTREGSTIGTPDYMAPEQALNPREADGRSDQYGLGCTFYFLLTGQPPFPGKSALDKLVKHQEEEPPPASSHRADVPRGVEMVLRRLMAKAPDKRYRNAAEAAEALTGAAGRRSNPPAAPELAAAARINRP